MKSTLSNRRELIEVVRAALSSSLTRQQMEEFDEIARIRPDIIDYYAGLAEAKFTVRRPHASEVV